MKNKKGFTLIEMIVVVAIIGVITAIVLPIMLTDNSADEANARARSFYFALQDVMTDYKLEYDSVDTSQQLEPNQIYYLKIKSSKVYVSSTNLSNLVGFTLSTNNAFTSDYKTGTFNQIMTQRLRPTVANTDKDGFYYAKIDGNYRVLETYWSASEYEGGNTFVKENRIGGVAVGAFPFENGEAGKVMLS